MRDFIVEHEKTVLSRHQSNILEGNPIKNYERIMYKDLISFIGLAPNKQNTIKPRLMTIVFT